MKVGDKVKLKNCSINDESYLRKFKHQVGEVIAICHGERHCRIRFSSFRDYEDVGNWRLEIVRKTS